MQPYNALAEKQIEDLTKIDSNSPYKITIDNLKEARQILNAQFKQHPLDSKENTLSRITDIIKTYNSILDSYEKISNSDSSVIPEYIIAILASPTDININDVYKKLVELNSKNEELNSKNDELQETINDLEKRLEEDNEINLSLKNI